MHADADVLTAAEIAARLDALGVHEHPGDRDVLDKVCSPPTTWGFTGQWCRYAQVATEEWVTDELNSRHNETLDRYMRLASMWRYGCLPDEAALQNALDALAERLAELRHATGQTVGRYEAQSMWEWAADKVPRMTDERVRDEVKHSHDDGNRFFAKGAGLLALDLAETVMDSITCGIDDLTKQYYVYDGGVWRSGQGRIEERVAALLGNRYRSAHADTVLDLIRLSDVPRITCNPVPDYINVPNGMVDWKTGALIDHDPVQLCTVQLPVEYHADAVCPRVDQFLSDVLPGDCIESGFIWEVIGYAMYSGNPLHIAVLFYGIGRNGKGTLVRLLKALVGQHNCSAVGLHELTENRFRAATLHGKLANLAGDLPARWIGNTALFKAITGDDMIQGEHKYGQVFEFTPWALPVYSANKPFGSADSSEGWWSRWVVVEFPKVFTGTEDRHLDEQLQTEDELRGVMARGIAALPALMGRGRFAEPKSVRQAKVKFIAASDAVRSWINECAALSTAPGHPATNFTALTFRTRSTTAPPRP